MSRRIASCGVSAVSAMSALALLVISCASTSSEMAPRVAPDWVGRGGSSERFPSTRFLTGFAQTRDDPQAVESAKKRAVGSLAQQISLHIEADVTDVVRDSDGRIQVEFRSEIRVRSDLRLDGVRFETYQRRNDFYVLAVLERLPAALARRRERDRALVMTQKCLEGAERHERKGQAQNALIAYRGCRTALGSAREHDAVAVALQRGRALDDRAADQIARYSAQIGDRVRAIPHEDARSIRNAAEALAEQLSRGGVGRGGVVQVAPFRYRSWDVSSPFGRELALALQSAIARNRSLPGQPAGSNSAPGQEVVQDVVIRGRYRDAGEKFELRALAKEAGTGRLLGSAEIGLVASGIPESLGTRPPNFESFVRDADKLLGGEIVSGDLRIELRTNKGAEGLVFDEGEDLRLYVRVNTPAWVRLIYILSNGDHVPITDAWRIGAAQVNQLIEHPESFEIVPPFGVEMIHAIAHTEKPPMLVTRPTRVAGQDYEVIDGGADQIVRTRGFARKMRRQVAEQTLHLTTMQKQMP